MLDGIFRMPRDYEAYDDQHMGINMYDDYNFYPPGPASPLPSKSQLMEYLEEKLKEKQYEVYDYCQFYGHWDPLLVTVWLEKRNWLMERFEEEIGRKGMPNALKCVDKEIDHLDVVLSDVVTHGFLP